MTRSTEKHIAAIWDAIERCGQHLGSLSADSFLGGPALDTKDMPALTPVNRGGIPALAPSRERVVQIARTVHLIRSRGTGWLLMTHVPETSAQARLRTLRAIVDVAPDAVLDGMAPTNAFAATCSARSVESPGTCFSPSAPTLARRAGQHVPR